MPQVAAVVVAAGQGVRAGGDLPKQFRRIAGETLLEHALSAFATAPNIAFVQPVIRPKDLALVRTLISGMNVLEPVSGGPTRQTSVRAGLEALLPSSPDIGAKKTRLGTATEPIVIEVARKCPTSRRLAALPII